MKYHVNFPIIDYSEFKVIVDATDEDEALDLASRFYYEVWEGTISDGDTMKLELDDGTTTVAEFVSFEHVDQWEGTDDKEAVPEEEAAMAEKREYEAIHGPMRPPQQGETQ